MRSHRGLLLAAAITWLSGCAGVYAEAGLSVLPRTEYSLETKSAVDTVQASAFQTTSVLNLAVGAEFDIYRQWRAAAGYQGAIQSFGPGASDRFGGADARVDFTLVNISDSVKLRGAVGFGFGEGVGSGSLPSTSGGRLTYSGHEAAGGDGMVAIGLSWYTLPFLAFHLVLGPEILGSRVPGGSEVGLGATARLAVSLSFGDTRPNSTVVEKEKSHLNVMPAIAAGAKKLGCKVENVMRDSWAALSVVCPQDGREVLFFQNSEGVVMKCSHMTERECRKHLDTLLDALGKTHQPASGR
jgi:hypothetical protein